VESKDPPKNGPEEKKGLIRRFFGYFGKGHEHKELAKDSPFNSKEYNDIESHQPNQII
jgi:hypothetical protein